MSALGNMCRRMAHGQNWFGSAYRAFKTPISEMRGKSTVGAWGYVIAPIVLLQFGLGAGWIVPVMLRVMGNNEERAEGMEGSRTAWYEGVDMKKAHFKAAGKQAQSGRSAAATTPAFVNPFMTPGLAGARP